MAKFLRILRAIAGAVVIIGLCGMAIFGMNDIGLETNAPVQLFGIIAIVGGILSILLFFAQRAFRKKEEKREET